MQYSINPIDYKRLKRKARAAALHHMEVCGLIGLDNKSCLHLFFLHNSINIEGAFQISPQDISEMRTMITKRKLKLFGAFHSHPISEAIPGRKDKISGFYRGILLIYDVIGNEARLWRRCKIRNRYKVWELLLNK